MEVDGFYFSYSDHAIKRLKQRVLITNDKLSQYQAQSSFSQLVNAGKKVRKVNGHEYWFTHWPIRSKRPKRFVLVFKETDKIPVINSVWTMAMFADILERDGANPKWFLRLEKEEWEGNGNRNKIDEPREEN